MLAPTDEWDTELRTNCLPALESAGFEEDSVIRAFKILEGRLRSLLNASEDKTGTELAEEAFGKSGPLQLGKTRGEQEGLQRLYSGIFKLNRNASTHRFIRYSRSEALQLIGFVNLLLRWLERGLEGSAREMGVLREADQPVRYFFFDFDGDGRKERLVAIRRGDTDVATCKVVVLAEGEQGFKSTTLLEDEAADSFDCEIRDVNKDGVSEIIVSTRAGQTQIGHRSEWLRIWRWVGGKFEEITGGGVYSDYPRIELRDVDGDGREEITSYKRKPDLPQTAHEYSVVTYHWNGKRYEAVVTREESGPLPPETEETRIKRLVLRYEPAAEQFVRDLNNHPGAHVSWWISKRPDGPGNVWQVQLRQWHDRTTLGFTFNHYTVDLDKGTVRSMFFHKPDGTVASNDDWL